LTQTRSLNKYFQIYRQAVRKFALNFRLTLAYANPSLNNQPWCVYLLMALRLHYKIKTLISSFFTFLLIYIQGLEIFRLPQVFFSKILKCVRNITKNVITTYSFATKVVKWINVILVVWPSTSLVSLWCTTDLLLHFRLADLDQSV
jgi:hypothetical protein